MVDVDRLLRLVEQAGLEDDPEVQYLLREAVVTRSDQRRKEIQRLIEAKAAEKTEYPFTKNPIVNNLNQPDTLVLGKTFQPRRPYTLTEDDLAQHLLAVGETGSGKTTMIRQIMTQLTTPFWAFDRKQDYRHLTTELDQLLVLPWKQLRFNPVKPPPGVDPYKWIQTFTDIFGHSQSLLSGSKNYLLKSLVSLYIDYELFREVEPPFPSLFELKHSIEENQVNYVRKTSNYRDTVLNRLESMLLSSGQIFDCSQGYSIPQLLQRNVVLEIDGLTRDTQRFLQQILFAYVYEYQKQNTDRGNGVQIVFFIDEAKQTFSVYLEKQDAAGIPEIDDLTARAREMGIGLVAADQEASKLTDSLKANTKTKVLLPVGDQKQFQSIAKSMNLSSRQADFAQKLGTGEAIIQHGNSDPVPVKLHNHQLESTVSDQELEELQQNEWEQLEETHRQIPDSNTNNTIYGTSETASQDTTRSEKEGRTTESAETDRNNLSEESELLLKHIAENPFQFVTERYENLGFSYYKGNKAKSKLKEKELVEEKKLEKGSTRATLFEFTDKGRDLLEEIGIKFHVKGRGSISHQYWQHQAKKTLEEQGWQAQLEKEDADVHATKQDQKVAVEIAMGPNGREIEHIQKHLRNGFQTVVVACKNEQVQSKLQGKLDSDKIDGEQVEWTTVQTLNTIETLLNPE
ncbi:ATP-binding protein [Halobacteria archaeon AArc-curdl1]|uniref:ATP-binding protein n=1 Tax=Natronosalvus hydrolyticus TaxID=2979988 RepID=A0AAP2ZA34_9EURY|nr:ATP-binding protein [Halobacteria archaeon AArc-curdl1]